MSSWIRVCSADDVPFLEGRRVVVKGFYVGVFNTEEGFYAVGDVCPHKGGPLSDGQVASTTVSCPLHNQRVELKTGKVNSDPFCSVPAFPVEVRNGTVYVDASALEERPV